MVRYIISKNIGFADKIEGFITVIDNKYNLYINKKSNLINILDKKYIGDVPTVFNYPEMPILPDIYKIQVELA